MDPKAGVAQIDMAETLVDCLEICGVDVDVLTMLDALATAGVSLVDDGAAAVIAYQRAVGRAS